MTNGTDERVSHGSGDLGRRIVERRRQLGLTTEEVANRAGMAPGYLEYLEQTPSADPSAALLMRLAAALEVSISILRGGQQDQARGNGHADSRAVLFVLSQGECQDLLNNGGVGRVVFRTAGVPVALPVNFKVLKGDIVFRSTGGGSFSAIAADEPVSFEVDRIDDAMSEGWSVVATGTIHAVRDRENLLQVEALGVEPWAGDGRAVYFRVGITSLTGRRIQTAR
jgi:transcriptional regulator with XRE-family HTH domain